MQKDLLEAAEEHPDWKEKVLKKVIRLHEFVTRCIA
jgi:hypothetical protein